MPRSGRPRPVGRLLTATDSVLQGIINELADFIENQATRGSQHEAIEDLVGPLGHSLKTLGGILSNVGEIILLNVGNCTNQASDTT